MKIFFKFINVLILGLLLTEILQASADRAFKTDGIMQSCGKTVICGMDILQNPALTARSDAFLLSTSFMPGKFGLNDLNSSQILAAKDFGQIGVAGSFFYQGGDLFRNYDLIASVSYESTEMLSFGVGLDFGFISIKNYGSDFRVQAHVGGIIDFSEEFSAGFAMFNLNGRSFSGGEKTSSKTGLFGIGYQIDDNFALDFDFLVHINTGAGIATSFFWQPIDIFKLKVAYRTLPSSFELKTGFEITDNFAISLSAYYHSELGFNTIFFGDYFSTVTNF